MEYHIIELIGQEEGVGLYRATRAEDHQLVLLKRLPPGFHPRDLHALRNEYEIGSTLALPSTIKPLTFQSSGATPFLVFENFGGQPLARLLNAPMTLDRFLKLAIHIAYAVTNIHLKNVIHKNINPQNILVDLNTLETKLAGLGFATQIPSGRQVAQPPKLIEGVLPYLSPEQTGRMNRTVDSRSDLYAVGVIFYQMLTGRLPFDAMDPLEWIHCHIARSAPSVSSVNPQVPEVVSLIVTKLLAKLAEERYQSAHGLRVDLNRCLAQWIKEYRCDFFPVGESDLAPRFSVPEKLYGRETEAAMLLEGFERVVSSGIPELVLISGEPGIGKSSLINELWKPLVHRRGFFFSGKFDQYHRSIPYSTITQGFGSVVLEILAESEERFAFWKSTIQKAVGVNGQVIIDAIPQIEQIIGKQPPVPELPPAETKNRFFEVFQDLVGVFAQKAHPVVFFLDDMQWVDVPSLLLLSHLILSAKSNYLYVIGAFRDTAVGPTHCLRLSSEELRQAGITVSEIALGPLSLEHLTRMVADSVLRSEKEAEPLARLVYDKTAGNPFFVVQLLRAFYEEQLITHNPDTASWQWDFEKIVLKSYTDDIVELMITKLRRLSSANQEILKLASCVGNSSTIETIALISEQSTEAIRQALRELAREGMLLLTNGNYKFSHDRIQQAAYLLIHENQRTAVHLRIGRLLRSSTPEHELNKRVFEIVDQLNHGSGLLEDTNEREDLFKLNYMAGKKAKTLIAYGSASNYFEQAVSLLPPNAWISRYEESLALSLERAECEYLSGHEANCEALLEQILSNSRCDANRALVFRLRMRLYQLRGNFGFAVVAGLEALRLSGIVFPQNDHDIRQAIEDRHREIRDELQGKRILDLVNLPHATDSWAQATLELLAELIANSYFSSPVFPLVVFKLVDISLKYGNTADSTLGYAFFAIFEISNGEIMSGRDFSIISLQLAEKFEKARSKSVLLMVHGAILHWWKHVSFSLPVLDKASDIAREMGEMFYVAASSFHKAWRYLETGAPLDDTLDVCREAATIAKAYNDAGSARGIQLEQQFIARLKGITLGPASLENDVFNENKYLLGLEQIGANYEIAEFHILKIMLAVIFGNPNQGLKSARDAEKVLAAVAGTPHIVDYSLFYALAIASLYPEASPNDKENYLKLFSLHLEKLKLWAQHCPENFLNRYALSSAELARIENREFDAIRLYEQAIKSARDYGFVHYEALAYELASQFYRSRGLAAFANTYIAEAHDRYLRWGAHAKVMQIEQQHAHLFEHPTATPSVTVPVEHLDLISVIKASQTISKEILSERLIESLLQVILEQAGAQKGYLILARNCAFSIEAEASLDSGKIAARILPAWPFERSSLLPVSLVRHAATKGEPVLLGDASVSAGEFSADPYILHKKPRSVLCLPILRQSKLLGLVYLENNLIPNAFTADRITVLSLLGSQAAISIENASLLSKERQARANSEAAGLRSAFLARTSALLMESLDYDETLKRLANLCIESLADWSTIDLVEGDHFRRTGYHADPAQQAAFEQLRQRYPPERDSPHPASRCLRSGQPLYMPSINDSYLRETCVNQEHFELVKALGSRSIMAVPLVARNSVFGVLTLCSGTASRYSQEDFALAREVAHRAAIAIENARLHFETKSAVRLRDEFLSVASHELRTPMTTLMLTLNNLKKAPSTRPNDQELVTRMVNLAERQGQRLTRLIEELLEMSRIERRSLPLEYQEVELSALVRNILAQFEHDLAQNRCSVSLKAQPVYGQWDPSRLEQVIVNLLSNAMKFGPGKPIEIEISQRKEVARLVVQDHGMGISPNQQKQIFDRFVRGVSAKKYGGLGLGLYISRNLVEAHGGQIQVESELGQGSRFIVELPTISPAQQR